MAPLLALSPPSLSASLAPHATRPRSSPARSPRRSGPLDGWSFPTVFLLRSGPDAHVGSRRSVLRHALVVKSRTNWAGLVGSGHLCVSPLTANPDPPLGAAMALSARPASRHGAWVDRLAQGGEPAPGDRGAAERRGPEQPGGDRPGHRARAGDRLQHRPGAHRRRALVDDPGAAAGEEAPSGSPPPPGSWRASTSVTATCASPSATWPAAVVAQRRGTIAPTTTTGRAHARRHAARDSSSRPGPGTGLRADGRARAAGADR